VRGCATQQTRAAVAYVERVCLEEHELFLALFEPSPLALQCVRCQLGAR